MPQPDGTQKAMEVHDLRRSERGTGEGPSAVVHPRQHHDQRHRADTTVTGVDGATIKVKYKDGEKMIVVPPNAPIVRYEIGERRRPQAGRGIHRDCAATKKPDGTLEAGAHQRRPRRHGAAVTGCNRSGGAWRAGARIFISPIFHHLPKKRADTLPPTAQTMEFAEESRGRIAPLDWHAHCKIIAGPAALMRRQRWGRADVHVRQSFRSEARTEPHRLLVRPPRQPDRA